MSKSENMHKKQQIHSHILHRMNCSNANLLIYSCYLLSKAAAADDAAKILATQWRRFSLRLLPCTILGRFQRGGCISSPLWCAFFPLFLCTSKEIGPPEAFQEAPGRNIREINTAKKSSRNGGVILTLDSH